MMNPSSQKPMTNRSMLTSTIIPVLVYDDVPQAVSWLCKTFGFVEHLRIGNHRSQLRFGDGSLVVSERLRSDEAEVASAAFERGHSLLVRIQDIDRHYEHARACGASILSTPTTYPYGERQYSVEDLGGHRWTFSQSIADVDPEEWGGRIIEP